MSEEPWMERKNLAVQSAKKGMVWLLVFLALWLLASDWYLRSYGNLNGFIHINHFRGWALDLLAVYGTKLGDGLLGVLLCLAVVVLWQVRMGLVMMLGYAVSGILVQLGKNWLYADNVRPWREWGEVPGVVEVVKNYTLYGMNSFPSGHTTSAFALFGFLAVVWEKWPWRLLLLVPLIVGWSRIYLGQHHIVDVVAGGVLGMSTAIAMLWIYQRWGKPKKKWLEGRLWFLNKKPGTGEIAPN